MFVPQTGSPATFCSLRCAAPAGPGPVDPAICTLGRRLDSRHRSRSLHVRHPFAAPDQGDADLPAHWESSRGPAIIGPFQDRKHSALPRHRGRRRSGNCRANRRVMRPGGAGPLCPPDRDAPKTLKSDGGRVLRFLNLSWHGRLCLARPAVTGGSLSESRPSLEGYRSCDLPTSQLRRGHDDRERRIGRPFQNSATPMDTRYARSRCLHAGLLAIGVELGSNDKHRSEVPH